MVQTKASLAYFKDPLRKSQKIIQFPQIATDSAALITVSATKWPKNRQQVLFDLRKDADRNEHETLETFKTFSTDNSLWGNARACP